MAHIIPEGLSVHVIRRGNNRGPIFVDDYDRQLFIALLEIMSTRHGVAVHGYVLMTNHYHLIVTPPNTQGLRLMMRDVGREYVLRYNRRHDRIGTLWAGRGRRIVIQDERYWLTCLRYIEQNPVRAGLVDDAADYLWSSYRVHAFGEAQGWLTHHHLYETLGAADEERQEAYRGLFAENLGDAELVRQRLYLQRPRTATVVQVLPG
jgi:putative transposase